MVRTSSVDELDRAILEDLNVDARRSHRTIAHHLDVSPTTVSTRIARLEASGIIRGYVPILDDEQLGWDLWATIGIRISKGKLREVEERLARNPRAYAIYDLTGEFDALVIGRFRDRRDLDRFVKHALQGPPHRADQHPGGPQPGQGGPTGAGVPAPGGSGGFRLV
ncbi:Transcription regulator, AsnC-type, partial [mine drainage metagenome]